MAESSSTAAEASPAASTSVPDTALPLSARHQLIEWARTALPTIVGAIGLTGFVSILGGALIWVRFSTAALPADQAVGELPTSSLLVTGAVSLVLYLVLGLAAVALVYLLQRAVLTRVVDNSATPDKIKSLEREHALVLARMAQLSASIVELTPPVAPEAPADPADDPAKSVSQSGTPSKQQTQYEDALQKQLTGLESERLKAGERADQIAKDIYKAELEVSQNAPDAVRGGQYGLLVLAAVEFALVVVRTDARESSKIGLIALLGLAVAIAVGFGYGTSVKTEQENPAPAAGSPEYERRQSLRSRRVNVRWITVLLALGAAAWLVALDEWTLLPTLVCVGLTGANWAVSRLHPSRFFWLGISIFVSVVLFGAVLTYSRSNNAPSAQPAAVLLKDGCTAHGLWIGESSDRVFLARVDETNVAKHGEAPETQLSEGRIFWVSRSLVASESVGTLQRVRDAIAEAPRLESELSSIQVDDALTSQKCPAVDPAGKNAKKAKKSKKTEAKTKKAKGKGAKTQKKAGKTRA